MSHARENFGWGRPATIAAVFALGFVLAISISSADDVNPSKLSLPSNHAVDFTKDIKPIFETQCYKCHGPEKQKSDYRLDIQSSALKGGSIGSAIIPGDSPKSLLLQYVAGTHDEIRMPPKGEMLSSSQVGVLRAWIEQGAKWEAIDATTQITSWSLSQIKPHRIPKVQKKDWVQNPIDSFVLAKLEEKGMTPSAETDRRTLIRRVTFDLTGLPPSPAEVDAFRTDQSPDAYEKVVDRLLASPRYGERWARHWMDVVHFAETHGHDEDKPRENAWPYRDYLIRSFNSDKPYKKFVEEQLAGDVLDPTNPEATIATAFIAAGPWDESSQMGIMDGTIDKQIARYLDRDDMLTTTMSTFVSSTVHCARCHNHKFDPISQADYYSLQAVFAGVDRVDREFDADPKIATQRKDLLQQKKELEAGTFPLATLLSDQVQERVANWEKSRSPIAWTILDPSQFTSAGGATLTKLSDNSLLASGTIPAKETYTFTAASPLQKVTAIRLEVLADPRLPHNGPGRQPDNGNLHLSEFKVSLNSKKSPTTRPLPIATASADFDQDGWTITKAIDNNIDTAWGIHPKEGESHFAVFELKTPIEIQPGDTLSFTLEQQHGRQHVIGRLRLSVTTAAAPVRAKAFPDSIAAAIAIPSASRNPTQRADLARHVMKEYVAEQLAKLPPPQHIYAIASNFPAQGNFKPAIKPREVNILRRGDIRQPIEPATAGAMSCVTTLPARFKLADAQDEGQRRAALAHWITDPQNPLTWRSIVNRIWHYHFGRGIVETPNDFGKMGAMPTHPELLDWLAENFRDDPSQSIKTLHRLIVTSATYRQSSANNEKFAATDSENKYLWKMNRTRLDAEEVHDAILAISGQLDLTMGGPSIKQFVETKGVHETPNIDYAAYNPNAPGASRRSIYRFIFRTIPDPFMQTLDCPDSSQLAPKRETSVTALQALAMLNDRFVINQSTHIATRLTTSSPHQQSQVQSLYQLALSRPPTETEITLLTTYANKYGLANAIRMLINSNEFMFLN